MSSWARVGVKCVCVDNTDHPELVNGEQYTITAVSPHKNKRAGGKFKDTDLLVRVKEAQNWSFAWGFAIERFRPLITQEDDVAMFREWLVVKKVEEEA